MSAPISLVMARRWPNESASCTYRNCRSSRCTIGVGDGGGGSRKLDKCTTPSAAGLLVRPSSCVRIDNYHAAHGTLCKRGRSGGRGSREVACDCGKRGLELSVLV